MDATEIAKDINIVPTPQDEDHEVNSEDEFQELMQTLPKEKSWYGRDLCFYQGFWCPSPLIFKAVISFQKHFQPLDNDIILATAPKCGTTWLKSLIFTIVNRNHFALEDNPLLSSNSHNLIPFFEFDVYLGNPSPYLENNTCNPRIFSTHIPYASLPTSIVKDSNCKIVYACRNPLDMFISAWHFTDNLRPENVKPISLDEAFEMFCKGIHGFGPFCDHVLGYWEAKQNNPNKIFYVKYEDLKENIVSHTKEIAEFLGFPFSGEEEKQGVVEEIVKLCSFENLKELEVNKSGKRHHWLPNKAYFRKGVVGDWSNYLTPLMVERFHKLIQGKLDKSGLTFNLNCEPNKDAFA